MISHLSIPLPSSEQGQARQLWASCQRHGGPHPQPGRTHSGPAGETPDGLTSGAGAAGGAGQPAETWKQALLIVQPATLVRWQPNIYRWLWKRKSEPPQRRGRPPLLKGLVDLIQRMARENRTWGAERIRDELLKLGIRVAKSTILRSIRLMRKPPAPDQTWLTFLHNHASEIWAFDFLQTFDLFFRALFVFVIVELDTRRVVHFAVTRHPTDAWVAQQLREATPFGVRPRFLI